ncbi:hypothetical protein V493_05005 [Pseudogymnoascus sp. VKM F-4281 (FW-2241)]|nr:hypothetical protein V493_05005 [Pseudogymnoascus sp. VKM F-4281 (FW-2241)]
MQCKVYYTMYMAWHIQGLRRGAKRRPKREAAAVELGSLWSERGQWAMGNGRAKTRKWEPVTGLCSLVDGRMDREGGKRARKGPWGVFSWTWTHVDVQIHFSTFGTSECMSVHASASVQSISGICNHGSPGSPERRASMAGTAGMIDGQDAQGWYLLSLRTLSRSHRALTALFLGISSRLTRRLFHNPQNDNPQITSEPALTAATHTRFPQRPIIAPLNTTMVNNHPEPATPSPSRSPSPGLCMHAATTHAGSPPPPSLPYPKPVQRPQHARTHARMMHTCHRHMPPDPEEGRHRNPKLTRQEYRPRPPRHRRHSPLRRRRPARLDPEQKSYEIRRLCAPLTAIPVGLIGYPRLKKAPRHFLSAAENLSADHSLPPAAFYLLTPDIRARQSVPPYRIVVK